MSRLVLESKKIFLNKLRSRVSKYKLKSIYAYNIRFSHYLNKTNLYSIKLVMQDMLIKLCSLVI